MLHQLKKLSEHVYYLDGRGDKRPLLACIAGENQLLIVDAGYSVEHMQIMLDLIDEDECLSKLSKLGVLSDCHWYHVFGMQACHFPYVAHKLTKERLQEMSNWRWLDQDLSRHLKLGKLIPLEVKEIKKEVLNREHLKIQVPCIMYRHQLELDLGQITCLLEHVESDHSIDSTIVYLEEDKVLIVGDCMRVGMHYTTPSYSRILFNVIDTLLSYDAMYYVFSAESIVMDRNEFIEFCEYLRLLGATVSTHYDDFEAIEAELGKIKKEDVRFIHAFVEGLKRGKGLL